MTAYKIYAFGSNGSGQLGLRHKNDISRPETLETQVKSPIEHLAAGGNHTLVLADGKVTTYGKGMAPHIGIPCENGTDHQHRVSATWSASICVNNGEVSGIQSYGEGSHGELGQGIAKTHAELPTLIKAFYDGNMTSVLDISSGMGHTVVILSNGEVWGWGNGRKGQLGEPTGVVWKPREIKDAPFHAVKVVCGKDFTCFIGKQGEGRIHVLGLEKNDRFGLRASLPDAVSEWRDVAASWGSVYILKDNGKLLGFGRDDHGQLPPPGLPAVRQIAAGSEHCLALTTTGKVLAWGWGEHGNCGEPTDAEGDVKGRWNEIGVPGHASAVFAGCATSFVEVTLEQGDCGG